MTIEKQIEILIEDGCTKSEAEKHLNRGALVLDDFEENFDTYMKEWDYDEEEKEFYKKKVLQGCSILPSGLGKVGQAQALVLRVLFLTPQHIPPQ